MDSCVTCGHGRLKHVYGELVCRPGFPCSCQKYVPAAAAAAEPCPHLSASGISQRALDDPAKVWRCDGCGWLYVRTGPPLASRMVDVETVLHAYLAES